MAKHRYNIAVVGGGWAGCAAAVELTHLGQQVHLFEAAPRAGGRARATDIHGHIADNGQHIMLGAYRECLRLMRLVGIDTQKALLTLPLQMIYPASAVNHGSGMHFIAPRLPAPLHLLIALWQAKGLEVADKMALARFSTTARWMDWTLHQDCTVSELLQRFEQTDRLCQLMWNPLCVAALNTPPERASAQVFLHVLRDSLGSKRAASDMLVPKLNLSALFPDAAASYIESHGSQFSTGTAIKSLIRHDSSASATAQTSRWKLQLASGHSEDASEFDAIVLATDIANTKRLLATLPEVTDILPDVDYEAITTCYLQYPPHVRLPRAMFALKDDPEQQHWGQYVFDRGHLHPDQAGLLAVVISASQEREMGDHAAIASAIAQQLVQSLEQAALATPLWHKVISEKRATFSCKPSIVRPANQTSLATLMLAGDYTQSDYPATLEAAVRSGVNAAQLLLNNLKASR